MNNLGLPFYLDAFYVEGWILHSLSAKCGEPDWCRGESFGFRLGYLVQAVTWK